MSSSHLQWTEEYKITSYLVNLRKQAGLYSILNFIQDVGWQHSFKLGIKLPTHQGWVFTRQKLKMETWPHWNETVVIKTWLRKPEAAFIYRDYELSCNGKKIGECTSSFTVMDLSTRKLALQDWSHFPQFWQESEHNYSTKPEKIPFVNNTTTIAEFEVRNSDIDLNEHVNNTKYAQWILDSISIEKLKGGVYLKGYEVNFLAEMKLGDKITLQQADDQPGCSQFQGFRTSDQKPVFTAQLLTEDAP